MPESADTFQQLWGICEYSRALAAFRSTGYYNDVNSDSKGNMHKNNICSLQAYSLLEQGHLPEQMVSDFEPMEHIPEMVVY